MQRTFLLGETSSRHKRNSLPTAQSTSGSFPWCNSQRLTPNINQDNGRLTFLLGETSSREHRFEIKIVKNASPIPIGLKSFCNF